MTTTNVAPGPWRTRRTGPTVLAAAALAAATLAAAMTGSALAAPAGGSDVSQEIECLALTLYFEARSESDQGMLAVGHVVMNRTLHPLFPEKICKVVRQGGHELPRCQFTWWCDGRSDRPREARAWERSKALARRIFWRDSDDPTSDDPTQGALWYHADHVAPSWSDKLESGPKIGRHQFYRPLKANGTTRLPGND